LSAPILLNVCDCYLALTNNTSNRKNTQSPYGCKKNWEQLLTLLLRLRLMLYSASWKQSEKYYDDGYDKQYPYDCAKVQKDKANEPQ